jgi:hypothetical protein
MWQTKYHSIANSSLVPTSLYLHSNSTQILALKKNGFSEKKKSSQNFLIFFLPFFYATFQCGHYGVFKKFFKYFFDPEKVNKRASKVAHNRPRPFYFTVQPRPTAHSQELIFNIVKSRDQTTVILYVIPNLVKPITYIDTKFFKMYIIEISNTN